MRKNTASPEPAGSTTKTGLISISGRLAGWDGSIESLACQSRRSEILFRVMRKLGMFPQEKKKDLHAKALPADDSSWRKGSGGCEGGPQKVYGRPGALPVSTYRHWRVLQVPLPGGLLSAIYLLLRGLPEETGEVVCPQRCPCGRCPD